MDFSCAVTGMPGAIIYVEAIALLLPCKLYSEGSCNGGNSARRCNTITKTWRRSSRFNLYFVQKETRDQYRQLTMGTNVSVGTIKNFVHLLDDSENDFQEELDLERMRKQVVERIRENQALENDVNDLDVKIALVVHNVKTFEELDQGAAQIWG